MTKSHSRRLGATQDGAVSAPADPVLILARVHAAMDVLRHNTDVGAVEAYGAKNYDEHDRLNKSLSVLYAATAALQNAISYLPAASPAAAIIQLAFAASAVENVRWTEPGEYSDHADADRAQRHIEAALPVLAEAFGVDLQRWRLDFPAIQLPDPLRKGYLAEVANAVAFAPDERRQS